MKAAKYIILIVIMATVAYNSVYFKKLDEVNASRSAKQFNAAAYAQTFWTTKLIPNLDKAIDITQLTTMLSTNASKTFDTYSHALGIGNLRYFLVKGEGTIASVNEDDVSILLQPDTSRQILTLATEYIFGNAIRDATGLVNVNDFTNTMDFNNVSAELNKIIRERVLPPFKQQAKKGDKVEFTGAIELNKEHLDISKIEVMPVAIMSNE
jgi:predicted lipoprotein